MIVNKDECYAYFRTCLYIACKLEEISRRPRDIINICYSSQYPKDGILDLNDDVRYNLIYHSA